MPRVPPLSERSREAGRPITLDPWLARSARHAPAPFGLILLFRPGYHQARLVGGDHRLRPVSQPELGQHEADVRLHRLLGDDQAGGYLRVGQALRDEPQDLSLARSESGEGARRQRVGPRAESGELADQAPGDAGREQRLAGRDDPYALEQPLGSDVFEQEAAGAGAERVVDV